MQKINDYLKHKETDDQLSGAVLIAKDGQIILKQAYGFANHEKQITNTPDTIFRIASITKPITAIALMQLIEQDKLSLEHTLNQYIPDFHRGNEITMHHLLTNTAGIVDIGMIPAFHEQRESPTTLEHILSLFKDTPLMFEPGEKHFYSSLNYVLLTAVLEHVADMPYHKYLKKHIFEPANMPNSTADYNLPTTEQHACGYFVQDGSFVPAPALHMSWPRGAGGILSTINDLYNLDRALYTNTILKQPTTKHMYTRCAAIEDKDAFYCYGWDIGSMHGVDYVGHPGKMFGFTSFFARFIDDDATIIVLRNMEREDKDIDGLVNDLAGMLFS